MQRRKLADSEGTDAWEETSKQGLLEFASDICTRGICRIETISGTAFDPGLEDFSESVSRPKKVTAVSLGSSPNARLAPRAAHIIGIGRTTDLIYLDVNSWVCSANFSDD
jgi:hypothetical protein